MDKEPESIDQCHPFVMPRKFTGYEPDWKCATEEENDNIRFME